MRRKLLIRAWDIDEDLLTPAAARAGVQVEAVDNPALLLEADVALLHREQLSALPDLRRPEPQAAGPIVVALSDKADDTLELVETVNYVAAPSVHDLSLIHI